jgi:hypothetical protein
MTVLTGDFSPNDTFGFGRVACIVLKASRAIPRHLRIVLRKNRNFEVSMGGAPGANGSQGLQWAWRGAALTESRLAIANEYATLWVNGACFDVSLKEAQAIRETFEAHGLEIEHAKTASVANSSRATK